MVCVECLFTWYWLADLCTQEGIPFVLGHALYMKAIHGGKANHDQIDSHKIAVLVRGGMLPQAYVYPAERRATRDLLRRRRHLTRTRAELSAQTLPLVSTTSRRSASSSPTRRTEPAWRSVSPSRPSNRALRSTSR